jgi:hypothetical protein
MSPRLLAVTLFVIFCLVTLFVTSPRMPPTGDEPHYLIAAHSLAIDGDLSLRDDYSNQDYRIFYGGIITKRTTFNPDRTKELPAFSPGLSFFLTPFYWLAFHWFPTNLVPFLRCLMCAMTALALYQVMLFFRELSGSEKGIIPVIPVFALASPVITYCGLFYPEMIAFLLVVIALRQIHSAENHPWRCSILLSIISTGLIWIHPKYLALSVLVMLIGFRKLAIAARNKEYSLTAIRILHIFLSVAGLFTFFWFLYSEYGSWSPNRIYGGVQKETSLLALLSREGIDRVWTMIRMIPAYFVDQRFGIIVYAPVYIAFFPAVIWSTHNEGTKITPLLILFLAHFLLLSWGAQMGGFAPPSRHFVVMVPFLIIPILLTFSDWKRFQKILFLVLGGIGWLITIFILMNYRLVFTNTTWRNPEGFSEFWKHFHIEHLVPRLTSSPPDYVALAGWLAAVFIVLILLYPRIKRAAF